VRDMGAAADLLEQVKAPYRSAPPAVRASEEQPGAGEIKRKAVRTLAVETQSALVLTEHTDTATISSFVQEVRLVETAVQPGQIESAAAILERLRSSREQTLRYTVQAGDCLSVIASRHGISLDTLRGNNPQVKGDLIRVGQQLRITEEQPLLTVKTVELRTGQTRVPSGVLYEKDDTLAAGVIQIVTQGKAGLKNVTIQSVRLNGVLKEEWAVAEELLQAPVQTVVKQGTKKRPGYGTGSFSMPVLRGEVTSEFGLRWGKTHKGTDFVSEQRNVLASDGGSISFAGWKSGYGNCIVIDHKNGFETLYGHLSKMQVKEGDTVSKGEKIGIMGSTGNSTGVHLHFEIIRDGAQQNPLKYLS
jgi:murein DD-endopeptidase MepM/ murein hydrolase activator NlpD